MANVILSEISSFVLPSHRGLSRLEVVQDCLEKAQLIAAMGIAHPEDFDPAQRHQYLSMLDDWIALALHQLVGVLQSRAGQRQ